MIRISVSEKLRTLHEMQIEVQGYGTQPRGLLIPALSRRAIPGTLVDVLLQEQAPVYLL